MTNAKRVILITGTPGVGKTSVARMLASRINAVYVNLTKLATEENLILEFDVDRQTRIIDEAKVKHRLVEIIENAPRDVLIDGHYAVFVAPKNMVTHVFVLRRNPIELKKILEDRGFSGQKLWENLAAEILDVCLADALNFADESAKVCEVDVTGKNASEVVEEILVVLENERECFYGVVDWLGLLEQKGVLDEYLRV